jgi:threonine/homoserine/homoserine lactone efflux protein
MHELSPPPLLAAFLIASFVLAVTPGPGVVYIVARSIAYGRRSGLASVGGVALGNLGNAIGASIGLGALFAVSSTAFFVVKYAGAAYLIYLGLRVLTRPRGTEQLSGRAAHLSDSRAFRDGFVVALLNPKTALFFTAFLPQFMTPDASPLVQSLTLGTVFVVIAAITDTGYAMLAGGASTALTRCRSVTPIGRYATGGTFIGLGLFTALSGGRSALGARPPC